MGRIVACLVLAGAVVVVLLSGAPAQQTPPRPFDPVGRWRFFHTDGTPFNARLTVDHHADTDWEGGEHGIWRWEGNAVRMIYTDGWDDMLVLGQGGSFAKRGWSPDADRCGPASNETPAERLSTDPGPPF